ncbi:MAG: prolipoprotein diacylglyceryl transferase [Candidatus Cloacimonetes bacterium]|nr:prolipoprotein diacylglyceryl transferase [Candidatus Cloacimonas sp.]MDD2250280.1 prolipoprotein diacylglyceryl transferase [Candidatus Cloacimonadota bacterium]MCK9158769.1 prolipoprotein diacylglyceryl transferase [Candidatus Cloacimonas sp.]MCK9164979.1 prolipoprotein diacylglyceryl transferase [Candidatus Cloacimonas sp.]MDD3734346.1 prolipoprotein diacylglyceryl transferase [Candidatus Cloacimonadota bacterium]
MTYPNIDPNIVSFSIGNLNLHIRWYGLFYVLSFILAFILYKPFLKKRNIKLTKEQYESIIFYMMLGVILGGRLGYILFYNLRYYLSHPIMIFAVWEGGMSFHGGALGVIIAGLIFCHKHKLNFYAMADSAIPIVAIGLGLGRLGNFINAELYGKPTNLPWGMIFPGSDGAVRHPSQLYELILEGIVMFVITYFLLKKLKKEGVVFWSFIGLYGIFRFLIEFVREPDDLDFYTRSGYIFGFMSIGQFLSLLMMIIAIWGFYSIYKTPKKQEQRKTN